MHIFFPGISIILFLWESLNHWNVKTMSTCESSQTWNTQTYHYLQFYQSIGVSKHSFSNTWRYLYGTDWSTPTHPDSSWPARWVSYNAVPMWLLQVGAPFRVLFGHSAATVCTVALVTVVSEYPYGTFQLAVPTVVLRNMRSRPI